MTHPLALFTLMKGLHTSISKCQSAFKRPKIAHSLTKGQRISKSFPSCRNMYSALNYILSKSSREGRDFQICRYVKCLHFFKDNISRFTLFYHERRGVNQNISFQTISVCVQITNATSKLCLSLPIVNIILRDRTRDVIVILNKYCTSSIYCLFSLCPMRCLYYLRNNSGQSSNPF